jgi:hypothetical protein
MTLDTESVPYAKVLSLSLVKSAERSARGGPPTALAPSSAGHPAGPILPVPPGLTALPQSGRRTSVTRATTSSFLPAQSAQFSTRSPLTPS